MYHQARPLSPKTGCQDPKFSEIVFFYGKLRRINGVETDFVMQLSNEPTGIIINYDLLSLAIRFVSESSLNF